MKDLFQRPPGPSHAEERCPTGDVKAVRPEGGKLLFAPFSKKKEWAPLALSALCDLNEMVAGSEDLGTAADGVLEVFSTHLGTDRGVVAVFRSSGDGLKVISERGMDGGEFRRRHGAPGGGLCGALSSGNGPVILFRNGAAGGHGKDSAGGGGSPARRRVAFLCSPVPVNLPEVPFIAVDRIFPDGVDPAEDIRLLTAAAALLSPLFTAALREGKPLSNAGGSGASLGGILRRHIRAWVEPMENSRRLRSDVYERLVGEVEKILIAAALEKTGYVQTEAARFLGINRNTLAKKLRKYGLGKKG